MNYFMENIESSNTLIIINIATPPGYTIKKRNMACV